MSSTSTTSRPLEKTIVKQIRRAVQNEWPASFWFKSHGGPYQQAGLPDLMGSVEGRFVGIEVKRPGGKPTALQLATLRRIRKSGGIATVATSAEEAVQAIHRGLKKRRAQSKQTA